MLDAIREDMNVLFSRVFPPGEILSMFGEDGNGAYGRSEFPLFCQVRFFNVFATADDEDTPSDIYGLLRIYLDGYNSLVTGHAITDANLRISLNLALQKHAIDPTCLDWGAVCEQGGDYIALSIDVPKLMGWA
jgi:hypothetical protein